MIAAVTSALALGFSFQAPMGNEPVMARRALITGAGAALGTVHGPGAHRTVRVELAFLGNVGNAAAYDPRRHFDWLVACVVAIAELPIISPAGRPVAGVPVREELVGFVVVVVVAGVLDSPVEYFLQQSIMSMHVLM